MLDGVSLALVTLLVGVGLVWLLLPSVEQRLINKVPGPPGLPLLGNIFQIPYESVDFYQWMLDLYEKYKQYPVCKVTILRARYAFLWSAESVEAILTSNKEITKSDDYKMAETWLGQGLLTSTGQRWFDRRRVLTPSFHFRILGDFLQVINEQARVLVSKLDEQVDKGAFNVCPRITLCTLDIICETAMGKQVNAQDNSESDYVKSVQIMGELLVKRIRTPILWPDWLYFNLPVGREWRRCVNTVKGFARSVIEARYAEFQQKSGDAGETEVAEDPTGVKKRMAFLDTLLHLVKDGSDFTLDDVQEEVDTFMFAGHDTTSNSIAWAVYNIGAHPDVQKKLQKEVTSVLGEVDRDITDADLKQLKYLECVIKESMRVFATVPGVSRRLQEDMTIAGIVVPKGTTLNIHPLTLNRDERFFPNPEKFDPDRFTLDNSAGRHPFAFVPFSAGPRNCIGQKFAMMEMKVVLSYILRRYNVEVTQKPEELRPIAEMVLRPQNGIYIKLTEKT